MSDVQNCPDCWVEPGRVHVPGCDVARCLATGRQRLSCDDSEHLGFFCGYDTWSGLWPGSVECDRYGVDLNELTRGDRFVWDRVAREWRAKEGTTGA